MVVELRAKAALWRPELLIKPADKSRFMSRSAAVYGFSGILLSSFINSATANFKNTPSNCKNCFPVTSVGLSDQLTKNILRNKKSYFLCRKILAWLYKRRANFKRDIMLRPSCAGINNETECEENRKINEL